MADELREDDKPLRQCWGIKKNWHRCERLGDWRFFCQDHRWQPFKALAALFAASVGLASIQAAPFYKSLTHPLKEFWAERRTPPATGNRTAIYVARFGDDDLSALARERVIATLRTELGSERVEIISTGIVLTLTPDVSDDRAADQATTAARALLRDKHGDLLIWGKVDSVPGLQPQIELRFVTAETTAARDEPFGLTDKFMLDTDFIQEMGSALAGMVTVLAAPVFRNEGQYLVATLAPIVIRLQRLARNPPGGLRPDDRAQLLASYAVVQMAIGEQNGAAAPIEEAVTAYRTALEERTRARVPLDWAATQNNLGTALETIGERESGTTRLEEAVTAYRAALEEYTRARVPRHWATTQNNLGTALETLGSRESGTARLKEAVTAYRSALEESSRARVPLDWAATQNNLGTALLTLSKRESGTARLQEAVTTFRGALEVFDEKSSPYAHSMASRNLARALELLKIRGGA